MNTNALKRFAKEARLKLLSQVARKLEFVLTQDTAELRGKTKELNQLRQKINDLGQTQVIEMVAYTWFNRLVALRFMDANGYTLPKVLTPLPGMTNPEILQNALGGTLDPDLTLDRQRLNDLLDGRTAAADARTEAYKLLLVAACNQWSKAMPFMFERISDYTELLLPDDLLSDFGIVADIRQGMSDEDCQQEEVIGWLYQFYISDKKDNVFDGLKKNIKITAENIPAATQLFTPRWIVRYMVENTLGKLWLSLRPDSPLRQHMPYYIEAPEGNAPAPLPDGLRGVTDITFLDPCMGSGHVLVYAFDLFTKIYEEEGYNTNEIPALILQHNLFGLDIDPRAAQLAAFALTMKARSYYARFLRKPVAPRVMALENVSEDTITQAVKLPLTIDGKKLEKTTDLSLHLLTQADNFGSLIQLHPEECQAIQVQQGSLWEEQQQKLKTQADYLSRPYHCVVTNPPYMGGKGMNEALRDFVEKQYDKSKTDLMACFMERCLAFNPKNGKMALINQHSWMFLSSYAALRPYLIDHAQFESLLHLGPRTFPEIGGEKVQNAAFVLGNYEPVNKSVFIRLTDYGNAQLKEEKTLEAIQNTNCGWFYTAEQKDFKKISGNVISGYRIRDKRMYDIFKNNQTLETISISDGQNITANNEKYLRYYWEVNKVNVGTASKWVFYAKGGDFRKWWGNLSHVVDWSLEARTFYRTNNSARIIPEYLWFKRGITWTLLSSDKTGFRILPNFATFDKTGSSIFLKEEDDIEEILALLNSKVISFILGLFSETSAFQVREIRQIPITDLRVNKNLFRACISISQADWDSREISWDFQQNELIKQQKGAVSEAMEAYQSYWSEKFYELHRNEEELNRQFIEIYGLQEELTPEVPLEEITILQEEAKIVNGALSIEPVPVLLQLLSYAVGCLFGRYSLDKEGLILANQGETLQDFLQQIPNPSFLPDEDNIIPVLEGEWFNDDIVGRFRAFLKAAFGEEHFDQNLRFIEDTLGKDIRKYFVKDFYNDHIKRYKKRPIYWLFSSPKGHFKALMYLHRYQPDLCSKLLNDYLQAFISKLEAARHTQTMLSVREDISAREKIAANKEIDKLELMLKDCRDYERTLFLIATQKISMDLDDGVKVNYQKFKEVLVPIKGLEKEED
ncbi:BREX-1 system adenine-specific DNA-methyltransferase PglX [Runella zeae]|uniref:BREX-1 system adenine-specific DNA-methyltransferase PglX n=1 Tax=Runella zeae TaxID=94255 RepID=UPI002355F6FC|nr:BREX-1 system adenine-specific DNA-methyltransferase PglX [Runella zeae]